MRESGLRGAPGRPGGGGPAAALPPVPAVAEPEEMFPLFEGVDAAEVGRDLVGSGSVHRPDHAGRVRVVEEDKAGRERQEGGEEESRPHSVPAAG